MLMGLVYSYNLILKKVILLFQSFMVITGLLSVLPPPGPTYSHLVLDKEEDMYKEAGAGIAKGAKGQIKQNILDARL